MPERVVFDTNVIISGLLWRGKAYQCLLLARSGSCKLSTVQRCWPNYRKSYVTNLISLRRSTEP